jgi:uncharacterized membrane protein
MKTFSKHEAISYGWRNTIDNFIYFAGLALLAGGLPQLITQGADRIGDGLPFLGFVLYVAGIFFSFLLQLNFIRILLSYLDGTKLPIRELFVYNPKLWRFIGASILYGLIVLGGLILLIIPGLIWAIKYSLYPYTIIDKNDRAVQAIKRSGELTSGAKLQLLVFFIILGAINILGIIAFGIGLLITIPLTNLAIVYVYRRLSTQTEQIVVHEDHTPAVQPPPASNQSQPSA